MKYYDEEQIVRASSRDLKEMRLWLFKESVRLENEQVSLDMRFDELERFQLESEKELAAEKIRIARERKKLDEDRELFQKQLDILHRGFDELSGDRKKLEHEWVRLEQEKGYLAQERYEGEILFFRGAEGPLALKKRYRDLMKIYHPDNLHGDHQVVDRINEEYCELIRPYENYKNA